MTSEQYSKMTTEECVEHYYSLISKISMLVDDYKKSDNKDEIMCTIKTLFQEFNDYCMILSFNIEAVSMIKERNGECQ